MFLRQGGFAMEAAPDHVIQKLQRLFAETAELAVESDPAFKDAKRTPHYSKIEEAAHRIARQMSWQIQERLMREIAAERPTDASCPECGRVCELEQSLRTIQSIDGFVELLEWKGYCPRCRRAFFPSAGDVGAGQSGTDSDAGATDCLRGG